VSGHGARWPTAGTCYHPNRSTERRSARSADLRLGESKHGSSDDGSFIHYKVESVASEVTPPENIGLYAVKRV
jgi:hypothetical protein